MSKRDEHDLITWIAYHFAIRPTARQVTWLNLPLVKAVQSGAVDKLAKSAPLRKKAGALKVPVALLPDLIMKAYELVKVKDPLTKKTRSARRRR